MMNYMIIYTDGIFDLTHFGHGNVFKQIKEKFGDNSILIVGVLMTIVLNIKEYLL